MPESFLWEWGRVGTGNGARGGGDWHKDWCAHTPVSKVGLQGRAQPLCYRGLALLPAALLSVWSATDEGSNPDTHCAQSPGMLPT